MKILVIDDLGVGKDLVRKLEELHLVSFSIEDVEKPEMLVLLSVADQNVKTVGKVLEQRVDSVRLANHSVLDSAKHNKVLSSQIDDIFYNTDELINRLPFIQRRQSIRESRRRQFAAVFESTVEGIVIIDARGVIKLFNNAAEKIFGYASSEVIGLNVSVLMPLNYAVQHDRYLFNYLSTGRKKIIGIGREVSGKRKTGEIFPLDLAVSEFLIEGNIQFVGIVRDVSERRKLELEILRISEQERRRVGQDLHDGLGQMLTGISLIGRSLAVRLEKIDPETAEEMHELTDLVRESDRMARNIARGLVQVELEGDGMSAALRTLCSNAEKMFSIECTYREFGTVFLRDSSAASNLYRIAQESLSNAVKHGRASSVIVTLQSTEDTLVLSIEDNGVGFPDELKKERGMGVDIMGYRARIINARLEIEAEKGKGTIVRCTLSSNSF